MGSHPSTTERSKESQYPAFIIMDSIKKKMEKLSNETAIAEARISHFEEVKAANEAEAEKFEEQLRNVQKKMQAMESSFDVCTEDLFNQTLKLEEMEKKAGNAESEVSALRSRSDAECRAHARTRTREHAHMAPSTGTR